mgnify:CR=1 FL=1|jgi:hypothetical protein
MIAWIIVTLAFPFVFGLGFVVGWAFRYVTLQRPAPHG